jgi:hypothetical protein
MEVHVYQYECFEMGDKKYLRQITVDKSIQATASVANFITFGANIFRSGNRKLGYVSHSELQPVYKIDSSCYHLAEPGQIFNEFQLDFRCSILVTVGSKFKQHHKLTDATVFIKETVLITEKVMLKQIVAAFQDATDGFDTIANQILSKYSINLKSKPNGNKIAE